MLTASATPPVHPALFGALPQRLEVLVPHLALCVTELLAFPVATAIVTSLPLAALLVAVTTGLALAWLPGRITGGGGPIAAGSIGRSIVVTIATLPVTPIWLLLISLPSAPRHPPPPRPECFQAHLARSSQPLERFVEHGNLLVTDRIVVGGDAGSRRAC